MKTTLLNDSQVNPYDKVGTAMAKKMKVDTPFKKKKDKTNQQAMKQKKYEHKIITFDEYLNETKENKES